MFKLFTAFRLRKYPETLLILVNLIVWLCVLTTEKRPVHLNQSVYTLDTSPNPINCVHNLSLNHERQLRIAIVERCCKNLKNNSLFVLKHNAAAVSMDGTQVICLPGKAITTAGKMIADSYNHCTRILNNAEYVYTHPIDYIRNTSHLDLSHVEAILTHSNHTYFLMPSTNRCIILTISDRSRPGNTVAREIMRFGSNRFTYEHKMRRILGIHASLRMSSCFNFHIDGKLKAYNQALVISVAYLIIGIALERFLIHHYPAHDTVSTSTSESIIEQVTDQITAT